MTSKQLFLTSCTILAVVGVFFLVRKNKMTSQEKGNDPIPQFEKRIEVDIPNTRGKAHLELLPHKNQFVFSKGDEVNLIVSVSSDGKDVGGVDLQLTYDQAVLEYVSFESLLPEFDFYGDTTKTGLVLTGVKKLSVEKKIMMKDSSLGLLKFKAKKKGDSQLVIHAKADTENDSNINDIDGTDMLSQLSYPSIVVGGSLELGKSQMKVDGLSLTLTSLDRAPENCFDCISSAKVMASYGGKKQQLVYESGGIVGTIPQPQQFGPYVIELGTMHKDTVQLHIFDYRL